MRTEHLHQHGLAGGQDLERVVRRVQHHGDFRAHFALEQGARGQQANSAVDEQVEQPAELRQALLQRHRRGLHMTDAGRLQEACHGKRRIRQRAILAGNRRNLGWGR
ncbi:hypothetical protein D3C76_720260 [compost metagenome]